MKRYLLLFFVAVLFLFSPTAKSQILFVASLDSAQETPPTQSMAQGTAWAVLGADFKTVTYGVTYAHLDTTFTAAHFHVGAAGTSGPVVFPLTFSGNTTKGTWTAVPDSLVRAFLQGRMYVNVHSAKYLAGEIRGQFRMVSGAGFTISLPDTQVIASVDTLVRGTGWAWLDTTGRVRYRATIVGVKDSTRTLRFQIGATGTSNAINVPVTLVDSTTQDSAAMFPDSALVSLLKGQVFLGLRGNPDSTALLTGRLIAANGVRFSAWLGGAGENPPNNSKAQATAWATLSPDASALTYRVTYAHLDTTFTASHFHISPGGNVVHPISFNGNTSQGVWTNIPDSLLLALVKGNLYLNIHSVANPAGEIAGFVKIAQGVEFTISLDGTQETPPTGSPAMGTGWAVLDSGGTRISYRATIAGLSDTLTASHFHSGPPGVPGGVVMPITFTDSTTQGTWTSLPDSILTSLLAGNIYMNVHSKKDPGGEIRGQLLYRPSLATAIEPVPGKTLPTAFQLEQNYPNPFNPSTEIQFELNRASHVSLIIYNILGQQVATLVNDVKQAGVYRVTFDASRLSSGVYFYRLATDNGLVASKKMLLIK